MNKGKIKRETAARENGEARRRAMKFTAIRTKITDGPKGGWFFFSLDKSGRVPSKLDGRVSCPYWPRTEGLKTTIYIRSVVMCTTTQSVEIALVDFRQTCCWQTTFFITNHE